MFLEGQTEIAPHVCDKAQPGGPPAKGGGEVGHY
jgi:hypothetical protein